MSKLSTEVKIWLFLFFLAIIWGSSFILIKRGLLGLDPLQLAGLRVVSAGLILIPWSIPNIKKIPKEKFRFLLLVGIIGNMIPAFLFALAQQHIKSSMAGMLNGLTPMFTLIIGASLFSDKITSKKVWGILIGLLGSTALLFIGSEGQIGKFNYYALLVMLATFCYGMGINIIKSKLQGVNATITSSTALLFTLPFGLIYLIFDGYFFEVIQNSEIQIASIYIMLLGIVGTGFAVMMFYKLVEIANPLTASSVTYIIPFVAVLWGVFDGEKLFLLHFISLAIIIFGVYLINRAKG
ncbi:MAG: DMT family transporter [Cytophagales bacterium]